MAQINLILGFRWNGSHVDGPGRITQNLLFLKSGKNGSALIFVETP